MSTTESSSQLGDGTPAPAPCGRRIGRRRFIADAGLMHLARFDSLEMLSVAGTKATKDDVRHLRARMPRAIVLGGD